MTATFTVSCVGLVALVIVPASARADDTAFLVNAATVQPVGERREVSRSTGGGVDIQIRDDVLVVGIGGWAALGRPDGSGSLRDIYDLHVTCALGPDMGRRPPMMPFIGIGLDGLSITTHGDKHVLRGTTLGIDAMVGITGWINDAFVYRVTTSYLGAIVPGTGDALGGLVLQLGFGVAYD